MKTTIIRVLFFILMTTLVIVLPIWLSVLLIMSAIIYFNFYLEALFLSFILDSLYSTDFSIPFFWLSTSTAFLLVVMFAKTQIRK